MAKSPAFQFYAKDWLSDANVRSMSFAAKGVYMDLLAIYWNEGGLPASTDRLARLVGMAPAKFRRLWPSIEPCFVRIQERLSQKRLEDEKSKQEQFRQIQSEKGNKSAKSRAVNNGGQPRLNREATEQKVPVEPEVNSPFPFPFSTTSNEQRTTDSVADDAPPFDPPEEPGPFTETTAAVTTVVEPLPWNREAAELWWQEYHGDPPKAFFGALKALVKRESWERVRPALVTYMAETPAEFVNIAGKFVAAFGTWESRARGRPPTRGNGKAQERDDGDLAMIRAGLKGGGHDGRGVDQGNGGTPVLAGAGRLERAEGDPGHGVPARTRRAQ